MTHSAQAEEKTSRFTQFRLTRQLGILASNLARIKTYAADEATAAGCREIAEETMLFVETCAKTAPKTVLCQMVALSGYLRTVLTQLDKVGAVSPEVAQEADAWRRSLMLLSEIV
ncbi:MAG: hypothetical protein IH851_11905 [Armatimonadetes bacterium]|nr:hypothetical protein [Armatimonadota bacterium]